MMNLIKIEKLVIAGIVVSALTGILVLQRIVGWRG